MEFAPSVFGTVLACLTKRGHVELFVAKERATRPDVLFEEEDEDDGKRGGRGAFEKEEKDEKFFARRR